MSTRGLLATLGAVAFLALAAETAHAAAPSYCALYAREYAIYAVQDVTAVGVRQIMEDLAYFRCLNQDDDPPFPARSAYYSGGAGQGSTVVARAGDAGAGPEAVAIAAASGPLIGTPRAPARDTGVDAAITTGAISAPPTPASPPTAVIAAAAKQGAYQGSGLTPWTPEWQAWCAKFFPRSWDPLTGTVVHGSSTTGERVLCK